jgi:hypothetical protein
VTYGKPVIPRTKRHGQTASDFRSSRRWQVLRLRILRRDSHVCYWCGGIANQVDHLIPVSHGGDWWAETNLAASCGPCNRARPLTHTTGGRSQRNRGESHLVQHNNSFNRGLVADATGFFSGGAVGQMRPFAISLPVARTTGSPTSEYRQNGSTPEHVSAQNGSPAAPQSQQEAPGAALITRDYSRRSPEHGDG